MHVTQIHTRVLNFTLLDEEYIVWKAYDVYCKIKIIGLLSCFAHATYDDFIIELYNPKHIEHVIYKSIKKLTC